MLPSPPPGFSKVKRSSWRSQSKDSTDGKQQRRGSETWEFTHPKFRRGHRDLLAGVKRRKEGERTKRRQCETALRYTGLTFIAYRTVGVLAVLRHGIHAAPTRQFSAAASVVSLLPARLRQFLAFECSTCPWLFSHHGILKACTNVP